MTESSESPITMAADPFKQSSADFVLRSSDGVDFHVPTVILSQASPFFADMLTLPQPNTHTPNPIPPCDVSEDSKTLEIILRLCYPMAKLELTEPDDIVRVLNAATKYQMEWPISLLTRDLLSVMPRNPLKVWAIACHTRQDELVDTAASLLSSKGMGGFEAILQQEGLQILDGISAGDYYRLRQSIRSPIPVDTGALVLLSGIPNHFLSHASPPTSTSPVARGPVAAERSETPPTTRPTEVHGVPPFPSPDVILESTDGIHVHAHRPALCFHSPLLATLLVDAEAAEPWQPCAMSHLKLDMHSATLCSLLKVCYAAEELVLFDPPMLALVIAAAEKYQMESISRAAKKCLEEVADQHPLEVYAIAIKYGLSDTARVAARKMLKLPLEGQYVSAMEDIPALAYHRLLVYYNLCVEAVKVELESMKDWPPCLDDHFTNLLAELKDGSPGRDWPVTTAVLIGIAAHTSTGSSRYAVRGLLDKIIKVGSTLPQAIEQALGRLELEI